MKMLPLEFQKGSQKREFNGAAAQSFKVCVNIDSDDDICVIKEVPAVKFKKTSNAVSNGGPPFRQTVGEVVQADNKMVISGISRATMTIDNNERINNRIAQLSLRQQGDKPLLGIVVQQTPPLFSNPKLVSLPLVAQICPPTLLSPPSVSLPSNVSFTNNLSDASIRNIHTQLIDEDCNVGSQNVRRSNTLEIRNRQPPPKTSNACGFRARKLVDKNAPPAFPRSSTVSSNTSDINAKIKNILAHSSNESSARSSDVNTPAITKPVGTSVPSTSGRIASSGKVSLPNISARLPAGLTSSVKHKSAEFYLRSGPSSGFTRKQKFKGRFKCHQCCEVLPKNISMVNHAFAHFLNMPINVHGKEEEGDLRREEDDFDVEDFSRCNLCLAVMSSPHKLTVHLQQVHMKSGLHASVCYICSIVFESDLELFTHLYQKHSPGSNTSTLGDAPYVCKICKFKSSLFVDIKTHFNDEHSGTSNVLCPVCFDVFDCKSRGRKNKKSSIASTKSFINHLNSHLDSKFNCDSCQLRFVKARDLEKHSKIAHVVANKGLKQIDCGGLNRSRPIALHEIGGEKQWRRKLIRCHQHFLTLKEAKCIECRLAMTTLSHFNSRPKICGLCGFTTNCVSALNKHKAKHKEHGNTNNRIYLKTEVVMKEQAVCSCGFATYFGNKLACHLQMCEGSHGIAKIIETCNCDVKALSPVEYTNIARVLNLVPLIAVEIDESVTQTKHNEEMIVKLSMKNMAEKSMVSVTSPLNSRKPSMLMFHSKLAKQLHRFGSKSPTKRPKSHSSSDSETDTIQAPCPKRRKLEDIFVSRRSSADKSGSKYKMYREKAIIAGEYANKLNSKVFNME